MIAKTLLASAGLRPADPLTWALTRSPLGARPQTPIIARATALVMDLVDPASGSASRLNICFRVNHTLKKTPERGPN